jgi:hypothetical protein
MQDNPCLESVNSAYQMPVIAWQLKDINLNDTGLTYLSIR